MDYSTIQEDNSTGSSPWANSPQQQPRANFGTPINDDASLTPQVQPQPQPQTTYPYRNGAHDSQSTQNAEAYGSAPTGVENGHHDQTAHQPERPLGEGLRQQPQAQQQQQSHTAQPQKQQSQATPQRPQVQYKLQAKVNGLERSGRKDPILRFDVHVG